MRNATTGFRGALFTRNLFQNGGSTSYAEPVTIQGGTLRFGGDITILRLPGASRAMFTERGAGGVEFVLNDALTITLPQTYVKGKVILVDSDGPILFRDGDINKIRLAGKAGVTYKFDRSNNNELSITAGGDSTPARRGPALLALPPAPAPPPAPTVDRQERLVRETTRTRIHALPRRIARNVGTRSSRLRAPDRRNSTGRQLAMVMLADAPAGIDAPPKTPITVWTDTGYAVLESKSPETFKGDTISGVLGADILPTDKLMVGVALEHESSDLTLVTANGDFSSTGASAYLYGGYALASGLTLDAMVGYGRFRNDLSERRTGAATGGRYSSARLMGAATIRYTRPVGKFLLTGAAGYLHARESSLSYRVSDGEHIAGTRTHLGQASLELEAGYQTDGHYLFAKAGMDRDFVAPSGGDDSGGFIGGGFQITGGERLGVGLEAGYDVGRRHQRAFYFGASLSYALQ